MLSSRTKHRERRDAPFLRRVSSNLLSTSFVPTNDPAATPLLARAGCTRLELALAPAALAPEAEAQSSASSLSSDGVPTRDAVVRMLRLCLGLYETVMKPCNGWAIRICMFAL